MATLKIISTPQAPAQPNVQPPSTGVNHSGEKILQAAEHIGRITGNPLLSNIGMRTIARAGESALGLPGDIAQTVSNIAGVENKLPLPTSEGLRKGVKYLTGNALEPKDNLERVYDDFVGDLASILVPIPGTTALPIGKALKLAGAGTLGSEIAKAFGGSSTEQGLSKAGAQLFSSFAGGRKALTKQMNELYQAADAAGKDKFVATNSLFKKTSDLIRDLSRGYTTPGKKAALEPLFDLQTKAIREKLPLSDIRQFKMDVNTLLKDAPQEAIPHLKRVNGILNDTISQYAHENPGFGKPYQAAEKLYKGLNGSITDLGFIKKHIPESLIKSNTGKYILYGASLPSLGTVFTNPVGAAKKAIGGYGLYQAGKLGFQTFNLLSHSPEARKYYLQALKDAGQGNVKSATKNFAMFDKQAAKWEEKHEAPRRLRIVS